MEQANIHNILIGIDDNQLLCTKKMAKILDVSTQWLEIGRSKGYGPPFIKLSARAVRYRVGDVRAWVKKNAFTSTSGYDQPVQGGNNV